MRKKRPGFPQHCRRLHPQPTQPRDALSCRYATDRELQLTNADRRHLAVLGKALDRKLLLAHLAMASFRPFLA
jgi:hypothetical protein